MNHPQRLGKYTITAVLGEGAMGVVYRGHDPDIGRQVALKTVRAELLAGDEDAPPDAADNMAARFRNEARAVGRLSHPGIVQIYEYGEDAGTAYIAMEFVEGQTLAQLLASGPLLPEAELLRVMDQLLDALDCAHAAGVWHRDIKPANLIITATGRVKVTDFGIARIENAGLTLVNSQIGTPGYMAPEQYSGEGVDHRADLYAAGVLLYRMLTGRKPFEGGAASVMFKVMSTDPTPPSQVGDGGRPSSFDAIVARALARQPADRYPSAAAFRRALAERLQAAVEPGSVVTDLPTLVRRLPPAGAGAAGQVTGARAPSRDGDTLPNTANRSARPASQPHPTHGGAPGGAGAPGSHSGGTSAGSSADTTTGATRGTAGSISQVPTGWDAQHLAPVERALASVVGPMARLMVRQAARQLSPPGNVEALTAAITQQLADPADRARFAARLEAGTTATTATSATKASGTGLPTALTAATGLHPAPAADEAAGPTDAQVEQATRVLSRHVGPIARILVKKALAQRPAAHQFAEVLATLADGVDRATLLRELQARP